MANGSTTKRPREEEPEESDSDCILEFSDDDDESQDNKAQDKANKRVKLEGSRKSTAVRDAAVKKLRLASKGSIGIPAVRALLAKSGSSSTRFTDAAKETNLGSRKSGKKATAGSGSRKSSNTKGKESTGTRGVSPPIKSKKMKVAVIIFLHKGVINFEDMNVSDDEYGMDMDDDDALQPEYVLVKPPSQLSADVVQRHKHYGLAVVDGTSGMEIDREATFGDIEKILQGFFPDLFDWFDGLPKVEANLGANVDEPKHLPQWLLCTKLPGRSSGVSVAAGVAFPSGSDIDFNVQTKRSGFRENILILTTRTPVPVEILKNWKKRVGKKPEKSTPSIFPSVADDSDSDFPEYIIKLKELPSPDGELVNAIAGPSLAVASRSNDPQVAIKECDPEIINIGDSDPPTPPSTQHHRASPGFEVSNLNASFSGSFHVDESLKSLDPWAENVANHVWDF